MKDADRAALAAEANEIITPQVDLSVALDMLQDLRAGEAGDCEATAQLITRLIEEHPRIRPALRAAAIEARRLRWGESAQEATAVVDRVLRTSASAEGLTLLAAADITPERVRWLWRGRIALSAVNLLVGVPGLGKSMLAGLLAALASRGLLDGDHAGDPSDTIYATAEDSPAHTLVPRLMAADADLSRVHFVRIRRDGIDGGIVLPEDVPALQEAVERVQARMLVIDPLMAHLDGQIDSHRDHSIRSALAPVQKLAEDTSCAVMPIGHLNKAPGDDLFRRVGGSIGLTGAARNVLLMTRDPEVEDDDGARVLVHGKSNLAPLAATMRLRVDGAVVAGGDGQDIVTARIRLGEDAPHLGVADVLADESDDQRTERDEAAAFLMEILAEGAQPAKRIMREAREAGIAERTLKRAKKQLGIRSKREGSGWHWQPPPRVPPGNGTVGGGTVGNPSDHAHNLGLNGARGPNSESGTLPLDPTAEAVPNDLFDGDES